VIRLLRRPACPETARVTARRLRAQRHRSWIATSHRPLSIAWIFEHENRVAVVERAQRVGAIRGLTTIAVEQEPDIPRIPDSARKTDEPAVVNPTREAVIQPVMRGRKHHLAHHAWQPMNSTVLKPSNTIVQ
jgi:hypothetical protein